MERKRNILRALNAISPEKADMSVNEIKAMLAKDIETEDAKKAEHEEAVAKEFTGKYLVYREKCRVFGNTLRAMELTEVKVGSYNTDWERLYEVQGREVFFSQNHIHEREIRTEKTMSEAQLRECEVITEQEFRNYQKRYQKFVTLVHDILPKDESED